MASARGTSGTVRSPRSASRRATPGPTSRTCSLCGRTRPCAPGGAPPGWTVGFEAGRTEFLCVDCARANLRAIEGKLPAEYWE